ncbi:formyl transferase [uncultured Methylobacterium sp.]|uniref:glucosamine inositolphosphorylceramide transferase family protein n=1 Tax=uncultured Methylobacterium sp. TaxID=157278 RepID=UPI0035CA1DC7
MRLRLRLDGRRPRLWHALLLRRIADPAGRHGAVAIEVDARPGPDPWPANADLLFALEALIHRLPRNGASSPVPASDTSAWPQPGIDAPDLIIDLCGDVPAVGPVPVWRLSFDGLPGAAGLLASLLAGHAPVIALHDRDRLVASGRVGTERRGIILTSFDDALMRTVSLVAAALAGRDQGGLDPVRSRTSLAPACLPPGRVLARTGRMLAHAIAQRLYHLCYNAPHWRVGWRRLDGPDLIDLRRHPGTGWRDLPDDGRRFYADPFPLDHRGESWVFVEEFVHALGKGIVSAVRFGPAGPVGRPEPVLEEAEHLSYPFVFVRDGIAWMVPETGSAGTIDLYRAAAYPRGWVKEATLVSGVVASDATLVEHAGRWWMFATVRDAPLGAPLGSGSYSDALHLWSAPDFRGPWTPHAHNPVLVDVASARPAGRIAARGGRLIRPVQDCTEGYGRALALARIDRLDDDGYGQTVETLLRAGPEWPGNRIHTLNRSETLECIDGSVRSPRLRGLLAH